jgi:hypothetical protein
MDASAVGAVGAAGGAWWVAACVACAAVGRRCGVGYRRECAALHWPARKECCSWQGRVTLPWTVAWHVLP